VLTTPTKQPRLTRLRLKIQEIRHNRQRRTLHGVQAIKRQPVSDWVSGRLFSMVHTSNLVYNTCWEDPRLDREALEIGPDDTVAVITSAGCNALDYALCGPRRIHAIDMNPRQNALLELKIAGIRELEHAEFFRLFGEGHLPGFQRVYRSALRKHLSPYAQQYWDKRTRWFESKRSFYFRGTSGSVAHLIGLYIQRVAKIRPLIDRFLEAGNVDEQRHIYENGLKQAFWTGLVKRFVGSHATLSMLGVPRAQRQQVELHYGGGISEFVEECIETVFARLPFHDNYFWRVYITGKYTPECCPEYLKPAGFAALKAGLVDRIATHTDTVEGFLRKSPRPVSRFVLLDHMDWLSTHKYSWLMSEWQAIVDRATDDARIIFRSGGTKVEFVDPIEVTVNGQRRRLGDMLEYKTDLAERLHAQCRVHTYGSFHVAHLRK